MVDYSSLLADQNIQLPAVKAVDVGNSSGIAAQNIVDARTYTQKLEAAISNHGNAQERAAMQEKWNELKENLKIDNTLNRARAVEGEEYEKLVNTAASAFLKEPTALIGKPSVAVGR